MSEVGQDILKALAEVQEHIEGRKMLRSRVVNVAPQAIDVKAIRTRSGLSQAEFAALYGVSKRTVQEWEQSRRRPEGAARTLLKLIERRPEVVEWLASLPDTEDSSVAQEQ